MMPITAFSVEEVEWELTYKTSDCSKIRLVGLLFAQPQSKLAKEEILPHLEYFHHRSGPNVHFFCGGYGAFLPHGKYLDKIPIVPVVGWQWYFSPSQFNKFRKQVEQTIHSRYMGETDLILLNVNHMATGVRLDLKSARLFPLEKMYRDGLISSIRMFFEQVFQFAEEYEGSTAVEDFIRPPDMGDIRFISPNIGVLIERMNDAWSRDDYAGLLHASASIFETMAKDIVENPAVENQPLARFFELYRQQSALPQQSLDLVLNTYKLRNVTPLAGHGGTQSPQISRDQAKDIMKITRDFIRIEYAARAVWVGRTA